MKMTNQVALTVSIFSLLLTHSLNAECNYPKKDFVIPSGSNSTEPEMVKVMNKVKDYQASLSSYRACLEEDIKKISPESEAYAELESMMTQRFNASITEEENLAEEWGAAVRAFKAQ